MMRKKLCYAVASLALMATAADVFASACTATTTISGAGTLTNQNLCSASNQLVNDCGDGTSIGPAPEFIYSVTLGAGNAATFTLNATGMTAPYISLMQNVNGNCNSTGTCSGSYTSENVGSSGSDIQIGATNGSTTGQHFVVVTDASGSNPCPGSVTFSLTTGGTLPVALQSFSVQQ